MAKINFQVTLPIAGMTCASCSSRVESSLSEVPGVEEAAPHRLDRFAVELINEQNEELASTNQNGDPLPFPGEDVQVVVETDQRILGAPHGGAA